MPLHKISFTYIHLDGVFFTHRFFWSAFKMWKLDPFFFLSPSFALLLSRYLNVKCNSQTINLGLLDFGAAYTVVLTQVRNRRELNAAPTMCEAVRAPCAFVRLNRTRTKSRLSSWRTWWPTMCTSPGRSLSTPSWLWERSCSPSRAWSSPTRR